MIQKLAIKMKDITISQFDC